jgi:hypothetical protein
MGLRTTGRKERAFGLPPYANRRVGYSDLTLHLFFFETWVSPPRKGVWC